jgi:hypothetical protein
VAKGILLEEFHLTVFAPHGLPEEEYDAMHQALDDPRFRDELRRAVRGVVRRRPALAKVKVAITR